MDVSHTTISGHAVSAKGVKKFPELKFQQIF